MSTRPASGALVDFLVVSKRVQQRIGHEPPVVGNRWMVDGRACIVLRVIVLGPARLRVWLAPDLSHVVPTQSDPRW